MARKRILLSWSGGKDSAWALHLLRGDPAFEVVGLLTTVNQQFARVAMHGYRETLLDAQAKRRGCRCGKSRCRGPARMRFTKR